jgi:hypothetical protein
MRKFNTTGKILPEKHYFVDLTPQIDKLMALVEDGAYFVINRPRQFGKTTLLNFFVRHLLTSKAYVPALISFQRFAQRFDISEPEFYHKTAGFIAKSLYRSNSDAIDSEILHSEINDRDDFFDWLGSICQHLPGKLVLLVDEIDTVPETVVIGFLAGLREMFMDRDIEPAPHTVALVGVHDIRNLKARYRDETKTLGTDSPFNIAVTYELPPFSLENIRQYFSQHTEETGQVFDDKVIARVHHVTNGHPWLTSVLAKFMVEEIVPDRSQKILPTHAEAAIQKLINSRNPNFESLYNNARKPELFPLVLDLLLGRREGFSLLSDRINLGVKYGIFAEKDRQLVLANPIYVEALYQNFAEELEKNEIEELIESNRFEDKPGRLDFGKVIDKFQGFMMAKGAEVVKHPKFNHATGQLVFLSYLDLLVNGKGWTFKEVQSGEGRIDVLCCYGEQKEVVEIKMWYGERRYEEGLEQLAGYLESEGLDRGYMVVFDRRGVKPKEYTCKEHVANGKRIQAWVV